MALAALAFSQRLFHRSPLFWNSNAPLWRFFYSRLVRQKQEVKDFYLRENGVLSLSLDGTRHHQQREPHFLKKSQMSSVLVSQSRGLMLTSSKQEQNQRLEGSAQELIYETATQALLASNLEEIGKPIGKNAEVESNVDTAKSAPLVYKRRSKKNMLEKEILVMKDVDIELKHSVPLQVRTEVVATKDPRKNSRKRKEIKRSSQHIDVETLKKTSDFSQCTEADIVTNSQKKRVRAKTSQGRDGETSPGSQKSRKTAKTFQHTESEMISAKDSQCIEKVSGSRKRKTTNKPSPSVDATGSEKHEGDILIKQMDPWLLLVHKKVQTEWIAYNPLTMRQPKSASNSLKLLSWNVNGLRALLKGKGDQEPGAAILKLAQKEDFDILSLQETKLQEKDVLTIKEALLPGYDNSLWSCSTAKLGYSGTAVISRIKPLSVSYGLGIPNHDSEGRVITVEFERFFLVTSYVPNSGQKLERLAYRTEDWDSSFGNFIKTLEKSKPVILTGDLNCAHQEIDIYNPDGNRRSAGFTDEERASFEKNFLHGGLTDTFRRQHPNTVGYTYWGYRTAARPKNQGWRLDYFLVSDALLDLVHDSYILPDVEGSDHCPIGLTLKIANL